MGTKLEQFRAHKPRKTNYEKVFCVARREKSSYSVETGIKQREALETHTPSIPFLLLSSSFLSRGIVSNFNLDHIILHTRIYISYTWQCRNTRLYIFMATVAQYCTPPRELIFAKTSRPCVSKRIIQSA